jgi:hypothetical protein
MLCGTTEIDIASLQQHTTYLVRACRHDLASSCVRAHSHGTHTHAQGAYNANHKVIKWMWEVLREATTAERIAFLKFCTGADGMPVGGFGLLGDPPFQARAAQGC